MIRAKSEFSLSRGNLLRRGKKGMIYVRFQHAGRRYLRRTERFDEAGARVAAWQIYQAVISGQDGEPAPRKVRSATVADCVEVYQDGATTMERPVKRISMLTGISAIRTICRTVWPGRDLGKIKVSELNRDCVLAFRAARRAEDGIGAEGDSQHNYRLNRHIAKAQSLFGAEARKLYTAAGLSLPGEVLKTVRLREPQRIPRPVSASQVWRAHLRVARKFKRADPRCLVVYELMRYAGLRDSEVLAMRRHWIRYDGDVAYLDIINRSPMSDPAGAGYRPKNHRDRSVAVRRSLVERWLALLPPAAPHDHLIPADNRRQDSRWWRELSHTVRDCWPDQAKSLYELRRYAGSAYLSKTRDIPGTAKFLGDTIPVTFANYAWLLDEQTSTVL